MTAEIYTTDTQSHHPVTTHAARICDLVGEWRDRLNEPIARLLADARVELDEAEQGVLDLKAELIAKRRDLVLKQGSRKDLVALRKRIAEQAGLAEDLLHGLAEATRASATPLGSEALEVAAHLRRTCGMIRDGRATVFAAIEGDRIPSARAVSQLAVEISSAANKCDELERLVSEHGPVPEELTEKVAALRRTLGLIRGEMPVTSRAA